MQDVYRAIRARSLGAWAGGPSRRCRPSSDAELAMMYGEVGRLADEGLRLSLRQAENAALLVMAMQYAWAELWLEGYRAAGAALSAERDQRARTRRLIRRGVSPAAAAQALHIV
ncbi:MULTISPECIES: hypothetical protein [Methylobacterium]|nr:MULTISPECIES: hypothetical protein [Methylobacterium]MBA9063537.1 hypothetical protein [Methylobacterium fujisawaense]MDE4913337.1 hypothetical protein [Methylobacterium sp. 092160098-2]MDH3027665.1 hypothetical protein [Methylobacterium fujisawaense]